jgi:hypothetical protein
MHARTHVVTVAVAGASLLLGACADATRTPGGDQPRVAGPVLPFPPDEAAPAEAPRPAPAGPPAPRAESAERWQLGKPLNPSAPAPAPARPPTRAPEALAPAPPAPPAPAASAAPSAPGGGVLTPVFPHVRVDRSARAVEFDATVALDALDPGTPRVFLELLCCTPDTREHESLLVTPAQAAHVHAALLLVGLRPGAPGQVRFPAADAPGTPIAFLPPSGDAVNIELRWTGADGRARTATPSDWVRHATTGAPFPRDASHAWVFGGSGFGPAGGQAGAQSEVYAAQGAGTLISLTTFGTDTIAPRAVYSPDSGVHEPVWIADTRSVAPIGTKVAVRVTPAGGRVDPAPGIAPPQPVREGARPRFENTER